MTRKANGRRRPISHITLGRAARLHRVLSILDEGPRTRAELLTALGIGLRTFYRELELLKRCGITVRLDQGRYALTSSAAEAQGRLPFPDPQLSFAEMAELSRCPGDAARRLADLLQSVVSPPAPAPSSRRSKSSASSRGAASPARTKRRP